MGTLVSTHQSHFLGVVGGGKCANTSEILFIYLFLDNVRTHFSPCSEAIKLDAAGLPDSPPLWKMERVREREREKERDRERVRENDWRATARRGRGSFYSRRIRMSQT